MKEEATYTKEVFQEVGDGEKRLEPALSEIKKLS